MKTAMQPYVLTIVPPDADKVSEFTHETELNIWPVEDLLEVDWASVAGRRVVIMPAGKKSGLLQPDAVAKAATAAQASSVAVAKLPTKTPANWHAGLGVPSGVKPEAFRTAVAAAEHKQNSVGLPDIGLIAAAREEVPAFPIDALPGGLAKAVRIAAAAAAAPVDYVACSVLSAAAGLTGAGVDVRVRPGWVEPLVLWTMAVGDPSSNKSPSLAAVRTEIEAIERDSVREAARASDLTGSQVHADQIRVSDATIPAMYLSLADNGHGLLMLTDEASTWLANTAAPWKGSSNDRGAANKLYDGESLHWSRRSVSRRALHIPKAAASMTLAIQPDAIATVLGAEAISDGLLERFLYCWPDPADLRAPQPAPADVDWAFALIGRVMRRCYSLCQRAFEDAAPDVMQTEFTETGADILQDWRNAWFDEEEGCYGKVSAWTGKAPGHAARIAGVLHLLTWAIGDEEDVPDVISDDLVTQACSLRKDYFAPHLARVQADSSVPASEKMAAAAARWILRERPEQIDVLAFRTKAKVPGVRSMEEVKTALGELASRNWFARGTEIPDPRDWRSKLTPSILLHPALYATVDSRSVQN